MTLLFPFVASLLFVVGAMFAKRSSDLGGGIWENSFVANILTALFFSTLWLLGGKFPGWNFLYQPIIVAVIFVVSQALMFLALDRGDVSIATPVLGTKIIFVAVLQTLLTSTPVGPKLWIAAALATLAVVLLNSSAGGQHSRVAFTIATSLLCGLFFALFDVLVQNFTPHWGQGRFLPILFFFVALFSLGFIPFFKGPIRRQSKEIWRPMSLAGLFIGAQALTFVYAIASFGNATEMNVIYAARGLWSVIAVWLIGHWFHSHESSLGRAVFQRRIAGAGFLMVAILIVLM
ncbi:MAG: DMT family transporter [Verrucomicrobiales bacterium]|nr:DMT family transporter [Verrucomicrobiales bacterium]